jgi:hypothetical protein
MLWITEQWIELVLKKMKINFIKIIVTALMKKPEPEAQQEMALLRKN